MLDMTAAVTGLLCWRDSRLPHRNPRAARYFVCCCRRRSIACAICSCSVTGRGGDPKNVRERPGPEQDGSRLVQIHVHVAVQPYWDRTLVRPASFRHIAGQGDPPPPLNVLECLPDLQSRKILRPDWAEREQRNHDAVAYTSSAGKIELRKSLRLCHQCQASFHEPPRENKAVEFRSRLHHECEILFDLGEPG